MERKNQVWVSDITYIHTTKGWMYRRRHSALGYMTINEFDNELNKQQTAA